MAAGRIGERAFLAAMRELSEDEAIEVGCSTGSLVDGATAVQYIRDLAASWAKAKPPTRVEGREVTIVAAHLANKAYSFPTRGAARRIKAPILACIHTTGNRRTAANPDRHQAPRDERNYANRPGSNGPSAHYYVARDGWAIEAIDPARYAAWSNVDVARPVRVVAPSRAGRGPSQTPAFAVFAARRAPPGLPALPGQDQVSPTSLEATQESTRIIS